MKTNKFRVWDGKKFLAADSFCLFPEDDGTFTPRKLGAYGSLEDVPNAAIQQYTGLKNQNRKDIYEGDIVAWTFHSGGKEIFQVIWDDFYCGFAFALKDGRGLNHTGFKLLNSPHGNENYEVIGNIFENPELLQK